MYLTIVKPTLDRLVALVILLVTLPFQLVVIVLLFAANRGRVWFVQPRPGLGGKVFYIIKFRTMNDATDPKGALLPDDQRLTRIGKWIRSSSLDELPQLYNVLKGDMSIVGPRPLLVEYLPLYNAGQMRRHNVKPGITGWAQVNGRNTLLWPEKFEKDVWYADHVSWNLDIRILWMTFIRVLRAEGISSETSATMERFRGNE